MAIQCELLVIQSPLIDLSFPSGVICLFRRIEVITMNLKDSRFSHLREYGKGAYMERQYVIYFHSFYNFQPWSNIRLVLGKISTVLEMSIAVVHGRRFCQL